MNILFTHDLKEGLFHTRHTHKTFASIVFISFRLSTPSDATIPTSLFHGMLLIVPARVSYAPLPLILSSSTSKISVELAGITGGKPRAP